jgi:Tfp pilus assembly protein FimT
LNPLLSKLAVFSAGNSSGRLATAKIQNTEHQIQTRGNLFCTRPEAVRQLTKTNVPGNKKQESSKAQTHGNKR